MTGATPWTKEFLRNSIDSNLKKRLYEDCERSHSFASHWLHLMLIIRTASLDRFERIKKRIRTRVISSYAEEDIEVAAFDYLADFEELHGGGMYDHSLTIDMVLAFMEANDRNEDFRSPMRKIKRELEVKQLEIRHKSYEDAHKAMTNAKLDVRSVLTKAKNEYRALMNQGLWGPANHAKDSKAIRRDYNKVHMAEAGELKTLVNLLMQTNSSSSQRSN